ncbi:tetratricopeptide repeat protein [Nocardia mexicana]|uniref:Tetratricopeptide repeat protein n=1 Tax=Nocardia mexicana TaxID=279262 RepID=A0A370HFD1_9NOCA|nr:tetratricopeptide repeat protein [Nocardia mexicana]RDI55715.1 tetratricopeptide repeat protein [Nocardia mexicana]
MDDYYDLGGYSRAVTTDSPRAQVWFDRGLLWRYAFNYEESVRCFRRAVEHDPGCAMAHWGIAYAYGPYYNRPWDDFTAGELTDTLADIRAAIDTAVGLAAAATPVERALIRALAQRYPVVSDPSRDVFRAWEDAYATAMRAVYAEFPDDLDVCVLFAEAMMNRTPWDLWDLDGGVPAEGADTLETVAVLEHALRLDTQADPPNPGVLHLYIHAMEMSPHPERALREADALREAAPDAGHFLHMPSHIDILCGDYHAAVVANDRAIAADRRYVEREGAFNFYTHSRCHDYHLKLYAAMLLGQYEPALRAAVEMADTIPEELLRTATPPMADWLEGFVPMKLHVLVRFGKWREILDEPFPDDPELYLITTATLHYAKGVAHAVLGRTDLAAEDRKRFEQALARIPVRRKFFNNRYTDILGIAARMLAGEIDYRNGEFDSAFTHLRAAVELNDILPYDEPWGWMQPPRHALGALLLEQGRVAEALEVYETDLGLAPAATRAAVHRDNVWSLLGYVECLHRLARHDDAARAQHRLDLALARADPELRVSCFCRLDAPPQEACCPVEEATGCGH